MTAYELFILRRDGSLGPLFINRKQRVPIGVWVESEAHKTKGYAYRPGWHCTTKPFAPHLKQTINRVWCEVEITEDYNTIDRPEVQGSEWVLAKTLKVVRKISLEEVDEINKEGIT